MKTVAILCFIGFVVLAKSQAPDCSQFSGETYESCQEQTEQPVCSADGEMYLNPCMFCGAKSQNSSITYGGTC
uniref:Kazal-like domain-containing protein n=1 Tax=Ciona savignyi TaxID=51511 RepID=H2YSA0_CIOSA